ncbi:MAG: zf-HC2 domain-containing protein [Terracidiphilus sp.]
MNHDEAVAQMTVERYLLGELDPSARDDFEEHLFDCPDCALDTRVATAFIEGAKAELAEMAPARLGVKDTPGREKGRGLWFLAWRPAFAAPVFAALVAVVCYQNLVTFPALRNAAGQPVVIPVAPLSGATRGEVRPTVAASPAHGIALPVDIPLDPALGAFVSYSFQIQDPQGKLAWSGSIPAPAQGTTGDYQLSLVMPGGILKDGAYSVSISGTGAHGESTPIEQYGFNVAVTK